MQATYRRLDNGQIIRVSPQRPWRGKSQRRQVIRERRVSRVAINLIKTGATIFERALQPLTSARS